LGSIDIGTDGFIAGCRFHVAQSSSDMSTAGIIAVDTSEREDTKAAHAAIGRDNLVTVSAVAILAYVATMMTHEALGHGALCIVTGGRNVMLTGWGEACDLHPVPMGITAAGPTLQFGAGLMAWLVLSKLTPGRYMVQRSFLWLYMVYSLFISSSYVAFSGLTNFGDGATIIAGLSPPWLWRTVLVVTGALAYYLSMWLAASELRRIIGDDNNRRISNFMWVAYLAIGLLACSAGALNTTMPHGVALELAALTSFGSGLGMVRLPDLQRGMTKQTSVPATSVNWSLPWVLGAVVGGTLFVFVLGPGIGARA
jgi:hypothetical protein